jgi:hypothetical protein
LWLSKLGITRLLVETSCDRSGAAGHNQAAVGVEDFIRSGTVELVRVVPELDRLGEPLCAGPGAGGVEQESLGQSDVSPTSSVPPEAVAGGAQTWGKAGRGFGQRPRKSLKWREKVLKVLKIGHAPAGARHV